MSEDEHLCSMSESAPLYALLIVVAALGGIAGLIWGLCYVLF